MNRFILPAMPLMMAALSLTVSGLDHLSPQDLQETYLTTARAMDSSYYAAGTKVDIAGFDLEELERQGKPTPAEVKAKVSATDKRLRAEWLGLENDRQSIKNTLRAIPNTPAAHELKIENLTAGGAGDSGWFAVRQATLVGPNGEKVTIEPSAFKGGAFIEKYAYQCQPSPCALVYGRGSRTWAMTSWFDLPVPATAGIRLVLSGLDQDKPGQTRIRILLNGITLFEGENGYQKDGWSEKSYTIPESAWAIAVKPATPESLLSLIEKWQEKVAAFSVKSKTAADEIEAVTQPLRKGLVWKKRSYPNDWWNQSFLRGMCLESDLNCPPDQHGRPWFADNFEYVSKAFASIGVNLIYLYPNERVTFPLLAAENEKLGTPVALCHWETAHPVRRKDKGVSFYLDAGAAASDVEGYLHAQGQGQGGATLRGITVDEPQIDGDVQNVLSTNPEAIEAWQRYLKSRGILPISEKMAESIKTRPILAVKTDEDRVAWTEWQYFKMEFISDFYAKLYKSLDKKGIFAFFVIQDYLQHDPQVAPYPYYGKKLPIVATDLYGNAGVSEAYGMDLLRSVSKGKAILLPGSGYSAKTPDRFHRTLANAMLRADGVVQWIFTYASKYRARYFFVRHDPKDDRGRDALDNWRPEYWDIQSAVYRGMEKAETYLTNTQPTARVAVLYSLRSVIAESATGGYWANTTARNGLFAYNALLNLHRPVEACMIEGLDPDKLKRYQVMFLMDAPALSPQECELLRNWVRSGGTLVVGANTSRQDQWGRWRPDYELADIFGLHFKKITTGVSAFDFQGANGKSCRVEYDKNCGVAGIVVDQAKILSRWENNAPALLVNHVGLGRVYYLSAQRPGFYTTADDPHSGLYAESKPGFPELFRYLATVHQSPPTVEIVGAPNDLEVQVRRKGQAIIVHLLDWREGRTINGLGLKVNVPGSWNVLYPMTGEDGGKTDSRTVANIRPIHVHSMIVLEKRSP